MIWNASKYIARKYVFALASVLIFDRFVMRLTVTELLTISVVACASAT